VVLFEPEKRVLISCDALWRNRVGVIFPELEGEDGFGPALQTIDALAALDATVVIPGHGAPFAGEEVSDALRLARERLVAHRRNPAGHARHALRVMVVYHLMEVREQAHAALLAWLAAMPLLVQSKVPALLSLPPEQLARDTLDGLIADGAVRLENGLVRWPA
jgi:glyoxylase-like metal-dependent hydrolase (beta-lactamase superfamily II)